MKLNIKKKNLKSLHNNQLVQQKTAQVAGATAAPPTYSVLKEACLWTVKYC